ncbi:ribosomal protein S8 [Auriculariales sp. MPI-PUGE-AT-0066]|nr:ribosomal protein S8 [Auriculariales sp. MPI-PUGE-AT-0066]
MVRVSVLNDCLNNIVNAEKRGKRQVLIRPSSKVIVKFLSVMQRHGYIGEFEVIDDHRSGKIVVQLNGRLNKTGVISPRYNLAVRDIENWVNLLLPSRGFGHIILTTSSGILDHEEARRKNVGGKILATSTRRCTFAFSFFILLLLLLLLSSAKKRDMRVCDVTMLLRIRIT